MDLPTVGLPTHSGRWKALQMLVLANLFWGLSFPTMKALSAVQELLLPGRSTWFIASLCLCYRFFAAGVLVGVLSFRTLRGITRSEITQGTVLGLFAAGGLVFQMDGLAHTSASTSAFLTQCYCVIIPVWVCGVERRWPSRITVLSCVLVIVGVGVLSGIKLHDFRLGRGEVETVIASVIFTGQILYLQRPEFASNNVQHFSCIMFLVIGLVCGGVSMITTHQISDWWRAYESGSALFFLGLLFVFCTLGAYTLMNRFQPALTSVQAGLIYCVEPIFASAFALFLPAWFSGLAKINYQNETLTTSLVVGGGLVTLANVIIQFDTPPKQSS